MGLFKDFLRSEDGFVAAEYAALVGALAIVSAMAVDAVEGLFENILERLDLQRAALPSAR